MTEKRFTLDLDSDWWTISDNTNDERLWGQDVVDLLNELHEGKVLLETPDIDYLFDKEQWKEFKKKVNEV